MAEETYEVECASLNTLLRDFFKESSMSGDYNLFATILVDVAAECCMRGIQNDDDKLIAVRAFSKLFAQALREYYEDTPEKW